MLNIDKVMRNGSVCRCMEAYTLPTDAYWLPVDCLQTTTELDMEESLNPEIRVTGASLENGGDENRTFSII